MILNFYLKNRQGCTYLKVILYISHIILSYFTYEICSKSIEAEVGFTKREMNNELNMNIRRFIAGREISF